MAGQGERGYFGIDGFLEKLNKYLVARVDLTHRAISSIAYISSDSSISFSQMSPKVSPLSFWHGKLIC
jgi:hypothetical protein